MTTTISPLGLHDLRELVRPTTPVASVYWGPHSDPADDGDLEFLLRRRAIARQLGDQGAENATVDAVGGHLARMPEYAGGCAVFARGADILLSQAMPDTSVPDLAAYGVPPRVVPLLAWLHRHPAHVQVVADRAGAELVAYPAGSMVGLPRTVTGPDDDIRRRFPGGGQQPRLQRRAEDSWRHNALAIASACQEELARVHAELLLISGDPRIVQLVSDRLRSGGRPPALRYLPGGGSGDTSAVTEALTAYAAARSAALVEHVVDHGGPCGDAVRGAIRTAAALAEGRLGTLLVVDHSGDSRLGWFSPELLCAVDKPAPPLLEGHPKAGRLVDVAVRAALLSRAEIRVLTPAQGSRLQDGIGGLVRHV